MSTEDVVDVLIRRLGQGRTHAARVPRFAISTDTFAGRAYRALPSPIAARCGALLRGQIVVMDGGAVVANCVQCGRIVIAEAQED